ncbi:heterokaryon incompatibility protein-domain-containing protein [Rhexocercosporidium sp. MPI-PUGE-AT-0058]|nr:heterokaryon incompatibility protein-domain-containing protein [Rhexocercosporidium sp. MPI-PUGE-AT-0058]
MSNDGKKALINIETLELEEFTNHPQNRYAILSHRWEEKEVSFKDWKARKCVKRPGYLTIMKFISKAAEHDLKYAWADTCCINKESSAELSGAINSMFKYYRDAAECYVYLSDLPPSCPSSNSDGTKPSTIGGISIGAEDPRESIFADSKWFTRRWMLQETIAPRTLQFFDSAWHLFGTKNVLRYIIERRTGVPKAILDGSQQLESSSIACRALPIAFLEFDIHMPLLYGEGDAAFIRLQEVICRKTTDMSLFA